MRRAGQITRHPCVKALRRVAATPVDRRRHRPVVSLRMVALRKCPRSVAVLPSPAGLIQWGSRRSAAVLHNRFRLNPGHRHNPVISQGKVRLM